MSQSAEKHKTTISDAVSRLIARAENSRGLAGGEVEPRVVSVVEKYLLKDDPGAEHNEVVAFVDEIRADDLCLIIACEKGDEKAWEDLVANFDSTVKSAAIRVSSNAEDG